jgi:hypothetical protein
MTLTLLALLLLGLGAHRLWMLWFYSKFTDGSRAWMGRQAGRWKIGPVVVGDWLAYGAGCQFCVSVWAGFMACMMWLHPVTQFMLVALAVGDLIFFITPMISFVEVSVQKKQAEIARIQAEIRSWNIPG